MQLNLGELLKLLVLFAIIILGWLVTGCDTLNRVPDMSEVVKFKRTKAESRNPETIPPPVGYQFIRDIDENY